MKILFYRLEGSPFRVIKRDPLLGGSIPQRAATACTPLLAGNSYGWTIVCDEPIRLERTWRGWRIHPSSYWSSYSRYLAASLRHEPCRHAADEEPTLSIRRADRGTVLRIHTGIWVEEESGSTLRLTNNSFRRHRGLQIENEIIAGGKPHALVLHLRLSTLPQERALTIVGELATIGPVAADIPWTAAGREQFRDLVGRHQDFFDKRYFDGKRGGPTRKYKAMLRSRSQQAPLEALSEQADAPQIVFASFANHHQSTEFAIQRSADIHYAEIRAALGFSAHFDGARVHFEYKSERLQERAREISDEWSALGEEIANRLAKHQGAMWYFSKYFTPHADGESNFFIKPATLALAPPGIALLVDGACGNDFDVLRGVIDTQIVGALPAVFAMHSTDTSIEDGQVLARVFAVEFASLTRAHAVQEIARSPIIAGSATHGA